MNRSEHRSAGEEFLQGKVEPRKPSFPPLYLALSNEGYASRLRRPWSEHKENELFSFAVSLM
jgi:hypothetical protein